MSKISETIILHGQSGTSYIFHLYELTDDLPHYASLYALLRRNSSAATENTNVVAYVGNTRDLCLNLQTGESRSLIEQTGANFVGMHQDTNSQMRERKADDLVSRLSPAGNRQQNA